MTSGPQIISVYAGMHRLEVSLEPQGLLIRHDEQVIGPLTLKQTTDLKDAISQIQWEDTPV